MKFASSRKENRVMRLRSILRKYLQVCRRARPSLASGFTVLHLTVAQRPDAKLGR
jgi:hypothetical protein